MLRVGDVSSLLAARRNLSSVSPRISIKPDLTEERRVEQILLKQHMDLIDSGVDRSTIKIRGSTMYREDRKNGRVVNDGFQEFSPATSPGS